MNLKLLIDDPGGRFKAGEIGLALPNDSSKYAYKVLLPGQIYLERFVGDKPLMMARIYYFFTEEAEVIVPEFSLPKLTKILEEIPPGESRLVIFTIKSQLFKANFGQFYTALRLWTSEGWQLYHKWDRPYPEPDVYDFAAKTAVALGAAAY